MERIPGVTRRPDGTVRIRHTARRRLLDAAVNLCVPLVFLAVSGMSWGWVALCAGCVGVGDLLSRRPGITLRPDVAVLHGAFRSRRLPWASIQAVTVDARSGRSVLLWTADHERIRLAAPAALRRGDHFDAGVDLIARHWLAHRGPDWVPAWPMPAVPPAA